MKSWLGISLMRRENTGIQRTHASFFRGLAVAQCGLEPAEEVLLSSGGLMTQWGRAPCMRERSVMGPRQAAVVPSRGCVGQKEALDQTLRQQLKLMAVTSGNPGRCLRSWCWGSLMNCRQDTDVLPCSSGTWPLVRQRGRRPTVPLCLRFLISQHSRLQIINYHGAAHL